MTPKGSSDGEELSELYLELVDAYKKRFMPQNGQVAELKCSPIFKKMRKSFKTLFEPKAQVHSQKEAWKRKSIAASARKGTLLSLWKKSSNMKGYQIVVDSYFNTWGRYLLQLQEED